jgi:hypothetical protein
VSSRGRLWALYRRHPYCFWCGVRVRKRPVPDGKRQPPRLATIDHLNTRAMYPDGRPRIPGRAIATVLSCWQCNQDRALAEQRGEDWIPPLMQTPLRTEKGMTDQVTEDRPGLDDPYIQLLIAAPAIAKGQRNDSILAVMNAAGKDGWTNHRILELGSRLAVRWEVSDPGKNLFRHWSQLLKALANVRAHYPGQPSR